MRPRSLRLSRRPDCSIVGGLANSRDFAPKANFELAVFECSNQRQQADQDFSNQQQSDERRYGPRQTRYDVRNEGSIVHRNR